MVEEKLKGMRYRRCYCRLGQLFDILDTELFEMISMQRRNLEVSSAPDEVQVVEISGRA